MAKATIALIISALCVLAFAGSALAKGGETLFHVEGRVYCDTCKVQFETRISEGIEGNKKK